MPLTLQQQNWISHSLTQGEQLLALQTDLNTHVALATLNSFGTNIVDADLLLIPGAAHLTRTKMVDAIAVFAAYITLLGDVNTPTTNAAKLAKLRG